jgi:iron(III) transport system permease protein
MKLEALKRNFESNSAKLIALIIVSAIAVPIFYTFVNAISENSSYMNLIIEEGILRSYLFTTVELILKVGLGASSIGFTGAYINVTYDYPFKKLLNLLFILPLSIPIYVGAYTYTEIYHDFPLLELLLKNAFTLNGSIFIYVIFLYPYVYLGSRSYLKNNMGEYIENAKVLGLRQLQIVYRVIVPLARPVIVASSLLVVFETLSDFAVLKYYGVETMSKLINDAWFVLGDKASASKLAVILLVVVFGIIFIEKLMRGRRKTISTFKRKIDAIEIKSWKRSFIYLFFTPVIVLGLVLPLSNIIRGAITNYEYFLKPGMLEAVFNTLLVAVIVIVIVSAIAMILSSTLRLFGSKLTQILYSIGTIGYSIPSMVLSLGVYVLLIKLDVWLYPFTSSLGLSKFLFTGTILALIVALSIKFLSIAFSQFYAQHQKLDKSLFEASTILGHGFYKTFKRVDIPLVKSTLKSITILLFIDIVKELTITYSLRPFNFNTLSTEVYRYAGNEMLSVAAVPGTIIILMSAILIIVLERGKKNAKTK